MARKSIIFTTTYTHMTNKFSKDDILLAITRDFYDDYEFINKVNDLTYFRKVQLYKQLHNNTNNGKEQND